MGRRNFKRGWGENGRRGQAMIEMAFLGFFLVLLAVIIVHYAVFFLTAQRVEGLTREGAQAAFHDCRALTNADEKLACLDTVATRLENILVNTLRTAEPVLPGDYRIFFTSWEFGDDPNDESAEDVVFMTPSAGGFDNPLIKGSLAEAGGSRYETAADFFVKNTQRNPVQDKGQVFICEVYYRHQASRVTESKSTTFFNYTFFLPLLNNTIYSSSVA
ncbi:MAG: pilus assembly protein [Candidatus Omnitrophica bacterium]|nr:pilus assembly protein [Candidatus Omnitrophota bacterium]